MGRIAASDRRIAVSTRMNRDEHRSERGQALVLVVLALVAMIGVTALVIDGGNAFAQQRGTQNASDAAALAGATVMVEHLGGATKVDSDVYAAITAKMTANSATFATADYVDSSYGTIRAVTNTAAAIPDAAFGVAVHGDRAFRTYMAGIVGLNNLSTGADATAVAGTLKGICAADQGCGLLPVTFSVNISDCTNNGNIVIGTNPWPLVSVATAQADKGVGAYEAIVPLCKVGPGGVGWLDMCPSGNLSQQITTGCNVAFDIPTWIHTSPGNPNNVESEMNAYDDQVIMLPLFDGTCRSIPASGLLPDCTNPGNGNNLYFHIPKFAGFLLDHAYIQGNNSGPCNSAPGITVTPPAGGNGGTTCLKGWFVRYVTQGPVGAFDPTQDSASALGVQLVH
jgi:Flp pilus assembly protein TadG